MSKQFDGYVRSINNLRTNKIWKKISSHETSYETELFRYYVENDLLALFALLNNRTVQYNMSIDTLQLCLRISEESNKIKLRFVLKHLAHATDVDGKTMLHYAAEWKDLNMIDMLVRKYNVPVDIADHHSRTPLSKAVEDMNSIITRLLINEYHADVNIKINRQRRTNGESLLHIAIDNEDYSIAEVLLENGADPNAATAYGYTPLHYAVQKEECNISMITKLIIYGANVNAKNEYGTSPLHRIAEYGTVFLAKLLVGFGADVNVFDSQRQTPLHLATNDRKSMVEYLISQNADVNAQSTAGYTPLHHAVIHRNFEIVKLLIENGADINIVDFGLQTPLSLATEMNLPGIWDLLAQQGVSITQRDSVNSGTSSNTPSDESNA